MAGPQKKELLFFCGLLNRPQRPQGSNKFRNSSKPYIYRAEHGSLANSPVNILLDQDESKRIHEVKCNYGITSIKPKPEQLPWNPGRGPEVYEPIHSLGPHFWIHWYTGPNETLYETDSMAFFWHKLLISLYVEGIEASYAYCRTLQTPWTYFNFFFL